MQIRALAGGSVEIVYAVGTRSPEASVHDADWSPASQPGSSRAT